MVSTVKSRPNHYELLGLTPAATAEEIAQAFARELGLLRPRAFGSLAEVTVAFETLRDPARRRAYDDSLGLDREPNPALSLAGRFDAAQFLAATSVTPAAKPYSTPFISPPVAPGSDPDQQLPPPAAPFATALPRQPTAALSPGGAPEPEAEPDEPRALPVDKPRPQPPISNAPIYDPAQTNRFHADREAPINWMVPTLAAGALILAVAVGAWTGWEAGNEKDSVTVKVPAAKSRPASTGAPETGVVALAEAKPEKVTPVAGPAPAPAARARPPLQIDLPEEQPTEPAVLQQQQPDVGPEQASAESPADAASSATLPLPDSVIARTIGRIGYPCGRVASTTALDGAGVFKVTCTSGHSYRAAPVRGRYHFRRMGKG